MSKQPSRARRLFLTFTAVAGAVSLAGLSACASLVAGKEEPRERRQSGGPVQLVLDTALEHGDLSAEQETAVLAIQERLQGQREQKRAMRKQMRASAIEIVRAGGSDSPDFERAVAQAMEAIEQRIQIGSDALKELHALLNSDQRTLVAEALREQLAERARERRERERSGKFGKIAARLMLDATQLGAIERLREELKEKHRELRPSEQEIGDLIDAFETEDFGAALDELCGEKRELIRTRLASAGGVVDDALSILTPDQRQLLATLIEEKDGEAAR